MTVPVYTSILPPPPNTMEVNGDHQLFGYQSLSSSFVWTQNTKDWGSVSWTEEEDWGGVCWTEEDWGYGCWTEEDWGYGCWTEEEDWGGVCWTEEDWGYGCWTEEEDWGGVCWTEEDWGGVCWTENQNQNQNPLYSPSVCKHTRNLLWFLRSSWCIHTYI